MQYQLTIQPKVTMQPGHDWLAELVAQDLLHGQSVQVFRDTAGKPWLQSPQGHYISASHSGIYNAAAIANKPVGIDIECRKYRIPELLEATTTAVERTELNALGPDALLAAWTAKEAAQKADVKIHAMQTYILSLSTAVPNHFSIHRGQHIWDGIWRMEAAYICALVIRR